MILEDKIPGISVILAIEDNQERWNAIQQLFDTSDRGAQLVDVLLQPIMRPVTLPKNSGILSSISGVFKK